MPFVRRASSVFPCASSVNIFSSVTSGSNGMKLPWQPKEKNFFYPQYPVGRFFKLFCRNVSWVTLYQIPSSQVDWSNKKRLPVGVTVLHYMPYVAIVKTLKIVFSKSICPISKSFCRNVPLVNLYQIL